MRDSSDTPQFSRYTIEGTLGSGGMGTVYLAYHEILNRPVALKVPKRELASSDHFVQRFLREAKALGTLHHRNIVSVYDAGIENDTPYIAMKYIAGKTLSELIRVSGQIEIDKVIRWGRQIADALSYLHDQNILHRDLKGANIIIDQAGDAIVADFGIAQIEADNKLTRGVLGTPSYMSPEQAMGKDLDARSDMHGLGVLLYQSLTGELPFKDENSYALIQKVIHETPSPVSDARPETPIWLENIVHKCLKKHPGQRFSDDRALLAAFDNALTRPVAASKSLTFLPARRRMSLVAPDPSPKQTSVRVLDFIQSKPKPISARLDSEHTITIFGPESKKASFFHRLLQHGLFLSCAALVALILVAPLTLSRLNEDSSAEPGPGKHAELHTSILSSNEINLPEPEKDKATPKVSTTPQTVDRPQLSDHQVETEPLVSSEASHRAVKDSQDAIPSSSLPVSKLPAEQLFELSAPIEPVSSNKDSVILLQEPSIPVQMKAEELVTPESISELVKISTRRELIRALESFRKDGQIRYGNRKRINEPDLAYIFLMNSSNEGLHAVLVPSQTGWRDTYTGRNYYQEKGTFYTISQDSDQKAVAEDVDPIWVEVVEEVAETKQAEPKRKVTGW